MKNLLLSLLLMVFALTANAQSNADDVYASNVKKLMELNSVKSTLSVTFGETYVAMAPQLGLSEAKARELGDVIAEALYADYIEICIPIYKRYYTLEDIRLACEFYSSPTGKKFAKYAPQISVDAMREVQTLMPKVISVAEEFITNNRGK